MTAKPVENKEKTEAKAKAEKEPAKTVEKKPKAAAKKAESSTPTTGNKNGLMYGGHPLRRVDNLIYYGSMSDKYIVMMQVLASEPLGDISIAKRISIQLQLTEPNLKSRDRVVRTTEKSSMAEAMEFATIWLDRALNGKM